MTIFTFRHLSFLSLFCLYFNLPIVKGFSTVDECSDNEVVELQQDHSRHTVFISEAVQNISICNLKPGKKYSIIVNSFEQNPDCIFELTHTKDFRAENFISDSNQLEFKASESCMDFVIRNANCIPNDIEYPVAISVSCKNCESDGIQNLLQMAGIATNSNYTTQQLIEDVLIGGGCFEVSNVSPIGNAAGRGVFTNGASSIGIDEGVILASGNIANAHGPNNVTNITTNFGDGSGDPDLDILSGGNVYDDVGIEFDFVPMQDMIEFNYVFASDEYCDYVNTSFNDVFGFFISGPGINGGFTLGAENIALIPGTNLYVSINNVNIQTNSAYYVDNVPLGQNQQGPFACTVDLSQQGYAINDIEYDGFTTVLTAQANVQICETYHIRMVVGDVTDRIFDSAVFLEANSFNAGGEASMSFDIPGIETNGFAYEGCSDGYILIERPAEANLSVDLIVEFSVDPSSTATSGEDFSPLPLSVTIPAGQTQVILPLEIYDDGLAEDIETLILNLVNPCSCDEANVEILISDVEPLAVATPDMEFCSETDSVQIAAVASGGVMNYTYEWSHGMITPAFTAPVAPGTNTFTVTVTDECGNTETSTSTIIVHPLETAEIEGLVEVCNGIPDNNLTVTFEGEGPWDLVILFDGTPVDSFEGLTENPFIYQPVEAGAYTLGSMFAGGCQGEAGGEGTVSENILLLTPEPLAVNCFGYDNGAVFLTVEGGTSNYTFVWSNDTYEQNAQNLGPGIYAVTVTDENGCTEETSVEVFAPDEIIATAVETQGVNCFDPNSGAAQLVVSGGTPGYTFQWESGSITEAPQNLSAGLHSVTVTDANGCTKDAVVDISIESASPIIETGVSGILTCDIQEVTLFGSNPDGEEISYDWFDENDTFIGNGEQIGVNTTGIYTLVATNVENGCTTEMTIGVDENLQAPIATIAPAGVLNCIITTIHLDGSASSTGNNFSFEWFDDTNTTISSDQDVVIGDPGVYSLLVTNTENGCTAMDFVTIVPDTNLPVAEAGLGGTLNCNVDAITLNASGSSQGINFSYEWQTAGGSIISTDLQTEVDQPGVYTFIVTNNDNGCVLEDEVEILEDVANPVSDIEGLGPLELNCDVSTVTLDGNNSMPFGIIGFAWSSANGNILTDPTASIIELDQPGIYTLTVTNLINGCTDTATFEITDDFAAPTAVINPAPMLTCLLPQTQLTAINTSGNGTFEYQWSSNPAGGVVSGETTLNPLVNQSGVYTLTILNLENGCESEFQVTVDEDMEEPDAQASVDDELDCVTEEVQLDGSGSSTGPIYNYQWSGAGIVQGTNSLQPVVNQSGTFTLVVTNTENGCTNSADVFVNENDNVPSAVDLLVTPPSCPGDRGSIEIASVTGGEGPYLYSIDGGINFHSVNLFTSLAPGHYPITIQDAIGCTYEDAVFIPEAIPVYVVTEVDAEIQLGDSIQLEALVNIPLSQIDTIFWTPSEFLSCTNCLNPYASPTAWTEYTVTVISVNGCMDSDKIILRVKKDRGIYIPNAFSPHNNDGINDAFMIYSDGKSVKNINAFKVFDRWGELVYEDYDFMPDDPLHSWDGRLREEPLNPAVFAYFAEIEFIDGVVILYKGDVTLLR